MYALSRSDLHLSPLIDNITSQVSSNLAWSLRPYLAPAAKQTQIRTSAINPQPFPRSLLSKRLAASIIASSLSFSIRLAFGTSSVTVLLFL